MATYVISDIHGELDKLKTLLDIIHFSPNDTLYVLGDIIDRGPEPIKTLQFLMGLPNAFCIMGNHEVMAYENLKLLMQEITNDLLLGLSDEHFGKLTDWIINGGNTTLEQLRALGRDDRQDILEYLSEFTGYEMLKVSGEKYLLVHAGLRNFSPGRPIEDYSIDELVWERPDYTKAYFDNIYVVTGHTPTQIIEDNPNPGRVYFSNNHIAIDCGACYPGGRLAAFCLDSQEAFYSDEK